MTTENICTCELACTEQAYRHTKTIQKGEHTVWNGLKLVAETIRDYTFEIYHYSREPKPEFSNGGTRVLIRPDRIDLI